MKRKLLLVTTLTLISLSSFSQNIFTAIKENDIPAVKHLLTKSMNINEKVNGYTPIMVAVVLNNDRAVKLLLEADADIDLQDKAGNTPLMMACQARNENQVAMLLNHYPNLNKQNAAGQTALIIAANSANPSNVQQLLAFGAKTSVKDKQRKTALDYAVAINQARIIALLTETETMHAQAVQPAL